MEADYLARLELVRKRMIQCGMKYGFVNEKTVKLSHEFDHMMNVYEKKVKRDNTTTLQFRKYL